MGNTQQKIKYRGATYVLVDSAPPKEITYKGAKYVLAAKVQFTEEERREAEKQVVEKYEHGQQLLDLWPRVTGILDSARQALDNYENALAQSAEAARKAFFDTEGGLKAITRGNYDQHISDLLTDPDYVQTILNNVSDRIAKSRALLQKALEFRRLFETAVYTETSNMIDPDIVEDVTKHKKTEIDKNTRKNLEYIIKHWPEDAANKLPNELRELYRKLH